MGGKAVTQGVRSDSPGGRQIQALPRHEPLDVARVETFAPHTDEHGNHTSIIRHPQALFQSQVSLQCSRRKFSKGDNPFLASFDEYADSLLVHVDRKSVV